MQDHSKLDEFVRDLNSDIRRYNEEQHKQHDPLKVAIAGIVDEKFLEETANAAKIDVAQLGNPQAKAPTRQQLKEWREWGAKWHKRHPFASPVDVAKAVAKKFNVHIIAE